MLDLGLLGAAGAPAGAYDLLQTEILTVNTASVTFSSLNSTYGSTYQHLQLRLTARMDQASGGYSPASMKINNGSGNGYSYHLLRGESGSVTSHANYNQGRIYYGRIPRDGYTANVFWGGVIDILDSFETSKHTTIRSFGGFNETVHIYSGALYDNTAAVDSIYIEAASGVNLVAGTRISLYGLKGA